MENMVELLNKIYESGGIWFYMVSLFSSDSLLSVEDCDRSIKLLNDTINAIPETNIPDDEKEKILDHCKGAIEICERDKKEFLKNLN